MKKFLGSILLFLLIFSCASNPSGGGGGGGSAPLVNQNNPSQTLENTPDLKLKLKDIPESLADESLKLKSLLKEALTMPVTNIPDVKGYAWYFMASLLQNSGTIQEQLESLKEFVKEYSIPLNQTVTIFEDQQQGLYYKVKVTTDGASGLRYYFLIQTYYIITKYYIHVYPIGNSMGGEIVLDYYPQGYGSFLRMFASFDASTGDMENSLYDSEMAFFWKVDWVSSSAVNIIVGNQDGATTTFTVANGDNSSGGVLYVSDDVNRYYEYYNNKGGLVLQRFSDATSQINKSLLKYLSLAPSYITYTLTRAPINTNVYESYWQWGETITNIFITNIYYNWWLDLANNNTYDPGVDISLIINDELSYTWSSVYNCIVPIDAPFFYWDDAGPVYFAFTETNLVNSVSNKLEGLYNQWKYTNIINYITNRNIPNPENFPE